jgi:hypothetical protein
MMQPRRQTVQHIHQRREYPMTDTLTLDDLPPERQAQLRASLARLPSNWRVLRIMPSMDGKGIVAELTDDSGEVIAQIVLM